MRKFVNRTSSVESSSGSFILLESKHFGTVSQSSNAALTSIFGSQISVADMDSYNENFSKLSISLLSKPGKIGFNAFFVKNGRIQTWNQVF